MEYEVLVEWKMATMVKVEAENEEEAIEKVEDNGEFEFPLVNVDKDGDYVDGSFVVVEAN